MTSPADDHTGRHIRVAAGIAALTAALGTAGCSTPASVEPKAGAADSVTPAPADSGPGRPQAAGPVVAGPMAAPTSSVLDSVEQTQRGSLQTGGIIRVVSARGDLSGQRELRWVAGGIEPYRDAECTQRFQLSNNPEPARKDNLLLCWRTSAKKSVIAVVVDPKGKPSKDKAVGELNKKWRAMG